MTLEFSFIPKTSNDPQYVGNMGQGLRWLLGKFKTEITHVSTTYTANTINEILLADASSAGFTITLPTAESFKGYYLHVKKVDNTGNMVTIDGNGSELIDGNLTVGINIPYVCLTFLSTGTEWVII